jgi:hypothetical protein
MAQKMTGLQNIYGVIGIGITALLLYLTPNIPKYQIEKGMKWFDNLRLLFD